MAFLIGVNEEDGTLHPEPGLHQPGVRICLDVDASLEPVWRLISARHPEGRLISARDRAALRIARVGMDPDRQWKTYP